jgi:hypothetical protein
VCSGVAQDCPEDASQPDGTSCDDGMECSDDDQCFDGACMGDEALCSADPIPGEKEPVGEGCECSSPGNSSAPTGTLWFGLCLVCVSLCRRRRQVRTASR